jgi:hypothetical protein
MEETRGEMKELSKEISTELCALLYCIREIIYQFIILGKMNFLYSSAFYTAHMGKYGGTFPKKLSIDAVSE